MSAIRSSVRRASRPSADATRTRILEAAEHLFAQRGFHGVTVREIAQEAGVDAALANYHFGSKDQLFSTALLSRAQSFMVEREDALRACIDAANGKPTLRDVIIAYTRPYLEHAQSGDLGWRSWFRLLAKANTAPEWSPDVWRDHFDPFVNKFIDAMKLAAPGAPEERYYWCYHFFAGALVLTFADPGRIDRLSGGVCKSGDLAEGYDLLVPFFAEGFEAILGGRSAAPETAAREAAQEGAQSAKSKGKK